MAESYDITGKVKVLESAETFGSGFTKRVIVITVEDGKYPQDINIEFVQDNVSKLDGVNIGDEVSITFDIRGREYNNRYFNNLVGWKIQVNSQSNEAPPSLEDEYTERDDDDVPFWGD